jgi:peptidoglycan hydrolase CwlO-like protein
MNKFLAVTCVLVLGFLVVNSVFMYRLSAELAQANEKLEDAKDLLAGVKDVVVEVDSLVKGIEKVRIKLDNLDEPAKDIEIKIK